MIFIPDKYVFIIGGNDTKCVFFNTETAEVDDWANLNKERIEPALILIKNNLYCFDNNNNNKNNEKFTIEKTDLDSLRPEWILITPKINNDMILGNINNNLNQENFGVDKDNEDNIIFIGGNMANENSKFNYKYNTKEDKIEITNIPFTEVNLKEKTFLPCKKNIDFILPEFDKENPKIIFFSKNKNKVEIVNKFLIMIIIIYLIQIVIELMILIISKKVKILIIILILILISIISIIILIII